jgi:3-hydroxybutyryl-CoA dehydratase
MSGQVVEAARRGRKLGAGEYGYDEIREGDHYETAGVTVTEAHIVGFAGLSGDLFDVHMDEDFAKSMGFPGRIAHGLLCLSLADGLKTRCSVRMLGIATLNWNWSFKAPVVIGDRVHATIAVASVRATRRPERGIATLKMQLIKQTGEVVQDGETLLLMRHSGKTG